MIDDYDPLADMARVRVGDAELRPGSCLACDSPRQFHKNPNLTGLELFLDGESVHTSAFAFRMHVRDVQLAPQTSPELQSATPAGYVFEGQTRLAPCLISGPGEVSMFVNDPPTIGCPRAQRRLDEHGKPITQIKSGFLELRRPE